MKIHWPATLLLVLLGVLYVFEISHGLPNRDVTWAYDANPLMPLIVAKRVFLDGWNTGFHGPYPHFHYILLLTVFVPYMGLQWLLGNLSGMEMSGGYPYGIKDFDTVFMHLAILTRAVSIAMALGTAYWTYRIGVALSSRATGLFAAMFVGLSPAIVYYVHTETLDVPMLFWLSAALYAYVRVLQSFELKYYLALAILAAVSTATKDYAYGAFVLMPIPLVIGLARSTSGEITLRAVWDALLDRRHFYSIGAFLVAFALSENWIWNFSGFVGHVKLAGGFVPPPPGGVISTQFGRFDLVSIERLHSVWIILRFGLGWISAPICLLALLWCIRTRQGLALTLLWPFAGIYVFTYAQVLPSDSSIVRPLLATAPILAIFGGTLLARIADWSRGGALRVIVIGLVVTGCVVNAAAVDVVLANDTRYQAESWIESNLSPGTTIDMFGRRADLPRYSERENVRVVCHLGNDKCDLRLDDKITSKMALVHRQPQFVVVASEYAQQFTLPQDSPPSQGVDSDLAMFFEGLAAGDYGYEARIRFEPEVANALRFPRHLRRGITIYERAHQ